MEVGYMIKGGARENISSEIIRNGSILKKRSYREGRSRGGVFRLPVHIALLGGSVLGEYVTENKILSFAALRFLALCGNVDD
jgi:hypothetical protein